MRKNLTHEQITELGNPRKPTGVAGAEMLLRMNESHAEVTAWALEFFEISDDDKILDVGCGGGACLKAMVQKNDAASALAANSENCKGKATFVGVDYSEVSVQTVNQTCAAEIAAGRMQIVHGDVENLPFADASFSKIITVESFYFWGNRKKGLQEVHRVLRDGGTFFLVADIFGKDDLSERAKENIARYDLFNPTPEEFSALMQEAGFSSLDIHTQGDWICVQARK